MPVTPNSNNFPPRPARRGGSSSPADSEREDEEEDWEFSGGEEDARRVGSADPSLSDDDDARSRGANAEAMGAAPPSRAEASEFDKQRTLFYGVVDAKLAAEQRSGGLLSAKAYKDIVSALRDWPDDKVPLPPFPLHGPTTHAPLLQTERAARKAIRPDVYKMNKRFAVFYVGGE